MLRENTLDIYIGYGLNDLEQPDEIGEKPLIFSPDRASCSDKESSMRNERRSLKQRILSVMSDMEQSHIYAV